MGNNNEWLVCVGVGAVLSAVYGGPLGFGVYVSGVKLTQAIVLDNNSEVEEENRRLREQLDQAQNDRDAQQRVNNERNNLDRDAPDIVQSLEDILQGLARRLPESSIRLVNFLNELEQKQIPIIFTNVMRVWQKYIPGFISRPEAGAGGQIPHGDVRLPQPEAAGHADEPRVAGGNVHAAGVFGGNNRGHPAGAGTADNRVNADEVPGALNPDFDNDGGPGETVGNHI